MSRVRLLTRVAGGLIKAAGKARNPAVKKAVTAGRKAVQANAARTTKSARAGRTLTPAQRKAAQAAKAKANPATPVSRRGRTVQSGGQVTGSSKSVARQASGPLKSGTPGNELARGNSPAKASPTNKAKVQQLKRQAQTQAADIAEKGAAGAPKSQPRGSSTANFLPNGGRVSPTYKGKAAKAQADRVAQAIEGKTGAARTAARQKALREGTADRAAIRSEAKTKTAGYQKAQEAKSLKGTTPAVRGKMAADMAKRPRVQGPKPAPTKTTGTNRIPANPATGTSRRGVTARTVDGKTIRNTKGNLTNNPRSRTNFDDQMPGNRVAERTLDPKTGRPYLGKGSRGTTKSTATPSSTVRQPRGGNPAENFPNRPGRAQLPEPKSAKPAGPGFDVRQSAHGKPGGIRPTDSRGSTTPTNYKGKALRDSVQTRNGRRVGRLGQPDSKPDTEALRTRAAANKARAADATPVTPAPPRQTPTRQQRLADMRAQRAQARADRAAGRVSGTDSQKDIQRSVNQANRDERMPKSPTTHSNGEVRLQGSKYSIDPQAKNLVDGSVSRTTSRGAKPPTRSAEANKAAKETVSRVRARRGQGSTPNQAATPHTAANRGVDRQGNNLQKIADGVLKSIGWSK